ncbi:MAG: threonine--tRNA ligase [Nitrospinota bacterium]
MNRLDTIRHSGAHIMAQAIKTIWPDAQFAFGPNVDDGFYYDVLLKDGLIKEEDLIRIEKEMKQIVKKNHSFKNEMVSKLDALELFKDQEFKQHFLTNQLKDDDLVSIYSQGSFTDLCKGPHVDRTGEVRAFKLHKIAGAYWLGDQSNKQLQRIYGLCFESKDQLAEHIKRLEEAKKRDHRLLSGKLKLFAWTDEGPGLPFMLPNGKILFDLLVEFNKQKNSERNYVEVATPAMLDSSLWSKSGHTDYYREHIYFSNVEKREFVIKPMNCPGSLLIYKNERRSFRDLPIRMAEFGQVHRHELSGVLHGLFRARAFTQDDAHIYCDKNDLEAELVDIIDLTVEVYNIFGFKEQQIYIATRPDKAIGDEATWDRATEALKSALKRRNIDFAIKEKEGAFYGPKIEFNVKDSIGRMWQLGTVQLDFFLPERFGLFFVNKEGENEIPVMIHRAIYGSLERFIGILIESYEGAFPPWLAPCQVEIIPVTDQLNEYGNQIQKRLADAGIRAKIDTAAERMQKKIRNGQMMKIPYMLIIGEEERDSNRISVRLRTGEQIKGILLESFIETVKKLSSSYSLNIWEG